MKGIIAIGAILALGSVTGLALLSPQEAPGMCLAVEPGEINAVDGFTVEQLANAREIMQAGADLGLSQRDQTIGVMTALGESGLRVLDYGDVIGPDSRGLFQQRDNGAWGSYSDRMNPYISATNFFKAMMRNVPDRKDLPPTEIAHRTQRNADPNHYAKYWDKAEIIVRSFGGVVCSSGVVPSGSSQELARQLVVAIDEGRLAGVGAPLSQIRGVAEGTSSPQCGIDERVLQTLLVALDEFDAVGVTSINRLCTNTIAGAGARSRHYIEGGGHAVDFYSLGGLPSTGADEHSIRLIRRLDPVLPPGSLIGQSQCRQSAGRVIQTRTPQFPDTCHHLHLDFDPSHRVGLGG